MSTFTAHDFSNALAAKVSSGGVALRANPGGILPWLHLLPDGTRVAYSDENMVTLEAVPATLVTTGREGIDAAWARSYALPEDAAIPAGTPYITCYESGQMLASIRGNEDSLSAHDESFKRRLLDAPAPARPEGAERIEEYLMDADRVGGEAYRKDGYKGLADYLANRIAREAGR